MSVLAFCRKPGLSLAFWKGCPPSWVRSSVSLSQARPVNYPLSAFPPSDSQGSHLALLHRGFTPLFSRLFQRSAGHWRFSSCLAVLAVCFIVAALRAFSGFAVVRLVAAGIPEHRRCKGGSSKIKNLTASFALVVGKPNWSRDGPELDSVCGPWPRPGDCCWRTYPC